MAAFLIEILLDLFCRGSHSLMQFSAADAIDLGAAFRASAVNNG